MSHEVYPVPLGRFDSFAGAAHRAKEILHRVAGEVCVRRNGNEWVVYVSRHVRYEENFDWLHAWRCRMEFDRMVEESKTDAERVAEVSDMDNERYRDEIVQLLIDEMFDEQENWARLEEDGWFYED